MKKLKYYIPALAIVCTGIFGTTSCVDDSESASVTQLRGARAEEIKSLAALNAANAEVSKIVAAANAKMLEAQAEEAKARAAQATAEAKVKEAMAAQTAAMTAQIVAKTAAEAEQAKELLEQAKQATITQTALALEKKLIAEAAAANQKVILEKAKSDLAIAQLQADMALVNTQAQLDVAKNQAQSDKDGVLLGAYQAYQQATNTIALANKAIATYNLDISNAESNILNKNLSLKERIDIAVAEENTKIETATKNKEAKTLEIKNLKLLQEQILGGMTQADFDKKIADLRAEILKLGSTDAPALMKLRDEANAARIEANTKLNEFRSLEIGFGQYVTKSYLGSNKYSYYTLGELGIQLEGFKTTRDADKKVYDDLDAKLNKAIADLVPLRDAFTAATVAREAAQKRITDAAAAIITAQTALTAAQTAEATLIASGTASTQALSDAAALVLAKTTAKVAANAEKTAADAALPAKFTAETNAQNDFWNAQGDINSLPNSIANAQLNYMYAQANVDVLTTTIAAYKGSNDTPKNLEIAYNEAWDKYNEAWDKLDAVQFQISTLQNEISAMQQIMFYDEYGNVSYNTNENLKNQIKAYETQSKAYDKQIADAQKEIIRVKALADLKDDSDGDVYLIKYYENQIAANKTLIAVQKDAISTAELKAKQAQAIIDDQTK